MSWRAVAIAALALIVLLVVFVVLTYFGTPSVDTGTGTVPG